MTSLIPNTPPIASCGCSNKCQCSETTETVFGDIFSNEALYKLEKSDSLCDAYEKINANMKMLADGYLLLAQKVIAREKVVFGSTLPLSFQGNFFFDTEHQKLFVWNEGQSCYIPSNGANTVNSKDEKLGENHVPDNTVPNFQNLRNICDGVDFNYFRNTYGMMEIVFVNSTPDCSVGLFIFDKSDCVMKIWSPEDGRYFPAYGCNSLPKLYDKKPSTLGSVTDVVDGS